MGTASGTVNFSSGASTLGSAVLVNGQAIINVSFSTYGNRSITAKYVGDLNNTASTSAALQQAVNKYTSSTSILSSLNPTNVGQAVTFTATIATSGNPTGR